VDVRFWFSSLERGLYYGIKIGRQEMPTKQNGTGAVVAGPGRGRSAASLPARQYYRRAKVALFLGAVALGALTAGVAEEATAAGNLPFTDPYRFAESPEIEALGFPTGSEPSLEVGMVVEREEAEKAGAPIDIVSASASNGKVTIDLTHADIGIFDLWDKWVAFDPNDHLGTWIITATDSKGASATTRPVVLDYGFEMPFLESVDVEKAASGDLKVNWSVPKLDSEVKENCDIDYRLRLLENVDKQFYRSDGTTEASITVPADTLKEKVGDSLDGVWGRIEMACRDKEQKNNAGDGQLKARSNTFFPLK
jgi:hypothetical protein